MKIVLIAPGIAPVPPNGNFAVETLLFDYYLYLTKMGHNVEIVNTPDRNEIIKLANKAQADVIHCHYDCFFDVLPQLKANLVCISSHYPYIDQIERHAYDDYGKIFRFMVENSEKYPIFAISEKDRNAFINWGANPNYVILMPNGANDKRFSYTKTPIFTDRSITLAQINPRKRQELTMEIPSVYYIGRGPCNHPNYLGEISDQQKFDILTNFANMVLVSNGENGTPLCIKEALVCGLGVVCTAAAASELAWDFPGIDIVSEQEILEKNHLEDIIVRNRERSLKIRPEIREYGLQFTWDKLIPKYVDNLKGFLNA
jgi:glycosyltransferase involved in cell wall biosynthesis